MDDNGKTYINTLLKNGLELFAFLGSHRKEVFLLIRAPHDKLRVYCDQLDFNILLEEKVLKELAEKGNENARIAPICISHNPLETTINPYKFIYAPYKIDLPHNLYSNGNGQSNSFSELVRLKITMSLIEAKPPDGGEHLKIRKYLLKNRILALFPLHTPSFRDALKSKLMRWDLIPWEEPVDDIKVL